MFFKRCLTTANCKTSILYYINLSVNCRYPPNQSTNWLSIDKNRLSLTSSANWMSLDLGVQIGGQDMELLFDSLSELETFRNKKSCLKSGRWFSWQNALSDHFGEYWATRMLLTFLYPDEKSPDNRSGRPLLTCAKVMMSLGLVACTWPCDAHHGKLGIPSRP